MDTGDRIMAKGRTWDVLAADADPDAAAWCVALDDPDHAEFIALAEVDAFVCTHYDAKGRPVRVTIPTA